MWPDVAIKSHPFLRNCPKCNWSSFYLKSTMFQTSPKSYPIFWLVCKKMGRQNLTKVAQSGHAVKTSSECMCGREGGEREGESKCEFVVQTDKWWMNKIERKMFSEQVKSGKPDLAWPYHFTLLGNSMTRLGDLLDFGQLFKGCDNKWFAQISHILRQFL